MSLIPFILDLADELQDYQRCLVSGCNAMDIDDTDFGLYPLHEASAQNHSQQQQAQQPQEQQQQQQQQQQPQQSQQQQQHQRRPRLLSQLYWQPNILQKHHHPHRHHPYQSHGGRFCCSGKERLGVERHLLGDKLSAANTLAGLPNKRAFPLIKKNGWVMVSMNVKQFAPNELIVKTVDNCIIIEGRHDDKEDIHGVISRHFIRKYLLPKGYDPNDVVSTLSSDGILTVKAPPPVPPKPRDEGTVRIVDIQQTGPAHSTSAIAAKDSEREVLAEKSKTPTPTPTPPTPSPPPPERGNTTDIEQSENIDAETEASVDADAENDSALESPPPALEGDISLSTIEKVENDKPKTKITPNKNESESIGMEIDADAIKAATTIATIATAVKILAESANPIAAAPTDETDLVDAVVRAAEIIAAEEAAANNNGAKMETEDEPNANNETERETETANANKNGDFASEQIPVDSAAKIPCDVRAAAATHAKELSIQKSVAMEAAATTATAADDPNDNDDDNEANDDADADDNDVDTNGRVGLETLANASEEVVAN